MALGGRKLGILFCTQTLHPHPKTGRNVNSQTQAWCGIFTNLMKKFAQLDFLAKFAVKFTDCWQSGNVAKSQRVECDDFQVPIRYFSGACRYPPPFENLIHILLKKIG